MPAATENLRRNVSLFMRVTASEKALLRKRARTEGLAMVEYVRCKVFDIPFQHVSGRLPARKNAETASHSEAVEATKATA
jgi:hypothetical protein